MCVSGQQAVYEPFCGSGTTIIAAEMTGRICHAIELSSAYIDVGVRQWQQFSGKEAVLDGDGRTFDQVAAERAGLWINEAKRSTNAGTASPASQAGRSTMQHGAMS
jgi:hypothetical protein